MSGNTDYTDDIRRLMSDLVPLQPCGQGSYGAVYVARDSTGRLVAVKYSRMLRDAGTERERAGLNDFCRKMRGVPNLISVYHAIVNDRELCYTMELADDFNQAACGQYEYCADTLERRISAADKRLSLKEIIGYARQMIAGVKALHREGLIHRDIKPANILFVNGILKIGDIGLVSQANSEPSAVGTPSYMPPEKRTDGNTEDFGSDLYALGMTIYCMMSGREAKFFPQMPAEVLRSPHFIQLNAFITHACSSNPSERFANIQEFQEEFERLVCQNGLELEKKRRRFRRTLNLFFALLLIASICLVFLYRARLRRQNNELYTPSDIQNALPWYAVITPSLRDSMVAFAQEFSDVPSQGDHWTLKQEDSKALSLQIDQTGLEGNFEIYFQFTCAIIRLDITLGPPGQCIHYERLVTSNGIFPPEQQPDLSAGGTDSKTWGMRLLAKDGVLRAFANTRQLSGAIRLSNAPTGQLLHIRATPLVDKPCRFEQIVLFSTSPEHQL